MRHVPDWECAWSVHDTVCAARCDPPASGRAHTYIYIHVHINVCMDVCMDVWMYGCMYVCMHACMYAGMHPPASPGTLPVPASSSRAAPPSTCVTAHTATSQRAHAVRPRRTARHVGCCSWRVLRDQAVLQDTPPLDAVDREANVPPLVVYRRRRRQRPVSHRDIVQAAGRVPACPHAAAAEHTGAHRY